jgi:hypothetical protein
MSYESDSHLTRHSPTVGESSHATSSPQTRYALPATGPLQQPPIAHVSPTLRSPAISRGLDPVRLQTSISSGESGSTLGTEYKQYPTYKYFQHSPQVERGIIEESIHRQSRAGSLQSGKLSGGSRHGGSPVVEDNSAVLQYIQEKSLAQEEEKEDDHALWILVSANVCRFKYRFLLTTISYGCHFSTHSTAFLAPYSQYSPPSSFSSSPLYDCVGKDALPAYHLSG